MTEQTAVPTRSIEVEVEIAASAESVWRALTDAQELQNWFPLEARVDPGVGGSVFISWGPGVEGEGAIELWEPGRHLRVIERSGTDDQGRPIRVAVDYHISTRGETSVLRVVHSGFSAEADWDEYYDTTTSGWRYFLWHLQFYLTRHAGVNRRMAWTRLASEAPRADVWTRLLGDEGLALTSPEGGAVAAPDVGARCSLRLGDERLSGGEVVVSERGVHMALTIEDLDDAVLLAELEPGGAGWHLGLWLSLYGLPEERVQDLQARVDSLGRRITGPVGDGS